MISRGTSGGDAPAMAEAISFFVGLTARWFRDAFCQEEVRLAAAQDRGGEARELERKLRRIEEELSDALTAQVEVRVKKRVKRGGRVEESGEVSIAFGSLDELSGLLERLRGEP